MSPSTLQGRNDGNRRGGGGRGERGGRRCGRALTTPRREERKHIDHLDHRQMALDAPRCTKVHLPNPRTEIIPPNTQLHEITYKPYSFHIHTYIHTQRERERAIYIYIHPIHSTPPVPFRLSPGTTGAHLFLLRFCSPTLGTQVDDGLQRNTCVQVWKWWQWWRWQWWKQWNREPEQGPHC